MPDIVKLPVLMVHRINEAEAKDKFFNCKKRTDDLMGEGPDSHFFTVLYGKAFVSRGDYLCCR